MVSWCYVSFCCCGVVCDVMFLCGCVVVLFGFVVLSGCCAVVLLCVVVGRLAVH